MKIRQLIVLIGFTSFSLASTSFAEIYKWTDKKGQVHYTQNPGPGNKADQLVDMKSQQMTRKSDSANNAELAQEKERQKEKAAKNYKEKLNKFCAQQRKNLKILGSAKPIAWEEDGETQLLSKQERHEKIDDIKDSLEENCDE
ncbi:MAG TPA: DUF4124 domain-containing protein [Leucothrix sp.]|nr:DUF4124 domain-containing protein [Leucothrix sp.]